jgi:hypothetical protein
MNNKLDCDTCGKRIIVAAVIFKDKYFCCVECYKRFKNKKD